MPGGPSAKAEAAGSLEPRQNHADDEVAAWNAARLPVYSPGGIQKCKRSFQTLSFLFFYVLGERSIS